MRKLKTVVLWVVRMCRVDRVNENDEHLVARCAEWVLFLEKIFFQHKMIHTQTWRRSNERSEQKSMTNHTAVDEKLRKDVLDAKVARGMFDMSDHSAVLDKIQTVDK